MLTALVTTVPHSQLFLLKKCDDIVSFEQLGPDVVIVFCLLWTNTMTF